MKSRNYREFLNTTGISLVEAVAEREDFGDKDLNGSLVLGDCNRTIHLEFGCSIDGTEEYSIQSRLDKLDKIQKAINLIRDGILEYQKERSKEIVKK